MNYQLFWFYFKNPFDEGIPVRTVLIQVQIKNKWKNQSHFSLMLSGLPWIPKVRQKDLDAFLENTRIKFVGFPLQGDRESLFGLPQPIHEGVRVLKQVHYLQ